MKRSLLSLCAGICSLIFNYTDVRAQEEFSVHRIATFPSLNLRSANNAGWLLFDGYRGATTQSMLVGPNGYSRDVSAFLNPGDSQQFVSNESVDLAGNLAFITESAPSSDRVESISISTLPLGKDVPFELGKIFLRPDETCVSAFNNQNNALLVPYAPEGVNQPLHVYSLRGSILRTTEFNFPRVMSSKWQKIELFLDHRGTGVLARIAILRNRKGTAEERLSDICTISPTGEVARCATDEQLKQYAIRGGYLHQLSSGLLTITSARRVVSVDIETLELVKNPLRSQLLRNLTDDGVSVELDFKGRNSKQLIQFSISSIRGSREGYSCTSLGQTGVTKQRYADLMVASSAHMFLHARETTAKGRTSSVLYELVRNAQGSANGPAAGTCSRDE